MNIYVGNLAFNVTEEELRRSFHEYGEVADVKLVKNNFSGQSKGYAFIDMPNNSEADAAIKALNKSQMKGSFIKVNQASPQGKKTKKRKK